MPGMRARVLVLVPEPMAALLAALLDESGYAPVSVNDAAEAAAALAALAPEAVLIWVAPTDSESVARLHALARGRRDVPLLAVVGPDDAASGRSLAQFGADGRILLTEDADREALEPLRQALEARAREQRRRRLGHAIP